MRIPLFFCLLIFSQSAWAQSARDQAADALNGVSGVSDILTNNNMVKTVVPFETDRPNESFLSPYDFEDRIFKIRTGNNPSSRAFGTTVDSALTRPVVDLGNDPFFLANDAVKASEDVTAGLFKGKTCETYYDGRTYSATKQCTRDMSANFQSCSEDRTVTVDRTDSWSCIEQDPIQTRACDRDVSWSCNGLQGQACITQSLLISGAPTWNAVRSQARLFLPSSGSSSCQLNRSTFTISAKDWTTFSQLIISRLSFNGTAQILINGRVAWTSAPSSGALHVDTRYCGKNCSRQAAYAGGTWIEDCSSTFRDFNTSIDLATAFSGRTLGPSTINSLNLDVSIGSSRTITVEVLRVNTHDRKIPLLINQQSTCCSSYLANTGDQCR